MRALLAVCMFCSASALGTFAFLVFRLISPSLWSLVIAAYIIAMVWLAAYTVESTLEKILHIQKPFTVSSIDAYLSMAQDVGLLGRSKLAIKEDASDAVRCEIELLLGELHAILITAWFDTLSPRDADFPRASRMAFSRAAIEVEDSVKKIGSVQTARAMLILAISHARRMKGELWPKTEEEEALNTTAEALVVTLLPAELCAPPIGPLLAALLAHGALGQALSLVAHPGWLQTQIAWALGGQADIIVERPSTLLLNKILDEGMPNEAKDEEEEAEATPEYEEASDLASSIAKLRALLAAKDEPEKASELPNDDRPFINLSIVGNEVVDKGSSGPPYVLYCIQYEVVVMAEGGLRLAVMQIKRRFQEFLNLQSRLEEQPHLKAALRGVKGPSKWLALAFSKAGQQTTAQRQPVLERYLQQLCEQPVLARSEAVQTFLAYGSSTAMAFTRGSTERLDKLLARTVSDVFHTIKTALPTFEDQVDEQPYVNDHYNVKYSFMERHPQTKELSRDIKKFVSSRVVEAASEAFAERPDRPRSSLVSPISPTIPTTTKTLPQQTIVSLAELLLQELCPSCWIWQSPLLGTFRLLFSVWLEHRLLQFANDLWSSHSALVILRLCRVALAPGPPRVKPTMEDGQLALASAIEFPSWLSLVFGGQAVIECKENLLGLLAREESNRQLCLDIALSAAYLTSK